MNNILVTTGWYSDTERWKQYENIDRSKLTFQPNWFRDYWLPQITHFIDPYFYFYISECPVKPDWDLLPNEIIDQVQFVIATKPASKLDHRHGFHAAIMNGLQFALTEGMNFLFIEQDCFVHNLDRVVEWCQENVIGDKWIAYGFGKYSLSQGWAEQSLIYVPNNRIALIQAILSGNRIHEGTGLPAPEVIFHHLLKHYVIPFQFGYGRHPVERWNKDEMFYRQQLTDSDIQNFIALRK